jgi:nucleotide-binding universal stress UspA family protein
MGQAQARGTRAGDFVTVGHTRETDPPCRSRLNPGGVGPTFSDVEHVRHVLCAIELGGGADEPLRQADRIARRLGARLTVLHVVPDGYPGVAMAPGGLEQALLQQQKLTREVGDHVGDLVGSVTRRGPGEVEIEVESGVPHDIIVKAAQERRAGLIVVAASGESGTRHVVLGSVAIHIARHAAASVLVTRPRKIGGHVIAATDFSDAATAAVMTAWDEARDRKAPLLVMHCIEPAAPELVVGDPGLAPVVTLPVEVTREIRASAQERLGRLLGSVEGPGEALVVEDPPSVAVVDSAKRLGADLVVVGASRKSGVGRLLLGSVADAVVREAPCSVLVIRTPDIDGDVDSATSAP